jgi:hypothetical protein
MLREEHWLIADLYGKPGLMPDGSNSTLGKEAIDCWTEASGMKGWLPV